MLPPPSTAILSTPSPPSNLIEPVRLAIGVEIDLPSTDNVQPVGGDANCSVASVIAMTISPLFTEILNPLFLPEKEVSAMTSVEPTKLVVKVTGGVADLFNSTLTSFDPP